MIEVVSPTSRRRDRVHEVVGTPSRHPVLRLVELEPDVEVLAYGLRGVYREAARLAEGAGDLPGPVPLRVDLAALR